MIGLTEPNGLKLNQETLCLVSLALLPAYFSFWDLTKRVQILGRGGGQIAPMLSALLALQFAKILGRIPARSATRISGGAWCISNFGDQIVELLRQLQSGYASFARSVA